MKKALLCVVILAVAAPLWAAVGDPIADAQYDHFLGYRDWKSYSGGFTSFARYLGVLYVDTSEFRYTPAQTVTFDTIRTMWSGGGFDIAGGRTVSVSVQTDTYAGPNYHDGDSGSFMPVNGLYPAEYIAAPDPNVYDGSWHIPTGTILGGGGNVAQNYIGNQGPDGDPNFAFVPQQDFALPSAVTMNAGQVYHIVFSVDLDERRTDDPNLLTANLDTTKLRLLTSGHPAQASTPDVGRTPSYRTTDGRTLDGWTTPDVAVGDDGLAATYLIHDAMNLYTWMYESREKWCEGGPDEDGYHWNPEYKLPRFELANQNADPNLDPVSSGVGQGASSTTIVGVPATYYGQRVDNMGYHEKVAMFVRKYNQEPDPNYAPVYTTDNLTIALLDPNGVELQTVNVTAASMPDGTAGWVVMDIPATDIQAGMMIAAKSVGVGYQIWQQNFDGAPGPEGSYGGTASCATADGADDTTADVLFMVGPHPADANRDGQVSVQDLGILGSNYQGAAGTPSKRWEQADFNNDGIVNVQDLGILGSNYGWAAGPAPPVPEPATVGLLVLGGLALLRRRRL